MVKHFTNFHPQLGLLWLRCAERREIDTIVELAGMKYGQISTANTLRQKAFEVWFDSGKVNFYVILYGPEIIAYINMIRLNDQPGTPGSDHLKGLIGEYGITIPMISGGPSTLILFQGSNLLAPHWANDETFDFYINSIYWVAAQEMHIEPNLFYATRIYAEPCIRDYAGVLELLGFTISDEKTKNGKTIFEINYSKDSWNDINIEAKKRIRSFRFR